MLRLQSYRNVGCLILNGLQGGEDGQCGRNILIRDGEEHPLAGKVTVLTREDDVIQIETPGGGGYGKVE